MSFCTSVAASKRIFVWESIPPEIKGIKYTKVANKLIKADSQYVSICFLFHDDLHRWSLFKDRESDAISKREAEPKIKYTLGAIYPLIVSRLQDEFALLSVNFRISCSFARYSSHTLSEFRVVSDARSSSLKKTKLGKPTLEIKKKKKARKGRKDKGADRKIKRVRRFLYSLWSRQTYFRSVNIAEAAQLSGKLFYSGRKGNPYWLAAIASTRLRRGSSERRKSKGMKRRLEKRQERRKGVVARGRGCGRAEIEERKKIEKSRSSPIPPTRRARGV